MLSAQNIHKSYSDLEVLRGINMDVKAGEIVSVVGASGAGKSTLLHILGTLDAPNSGSVKLDGHEITKIKNNQLADFRNQNIGFIFQFHNLLAEFTAKENILIPAYISSASGKQIEEKALELMDRLSISDRADHKPSELSGGEQQRASVARSLINDPKIVFADEPSGNLDSKNAAELHNLFFQLRDEFGYTFVIVTHNMELADMADRKLEILDGRIEN